MDARIPHSFGSAIMLAGAFAVGWVLHQVFVVESVGLTAPVSVFVGLAGVGLIALGRRLERRFDPSMFVPAAREDEEAAFDEALSPLEAEDLEGLERDESVER